jgi:hypothetical protein
MKKDEWKHKEANFIQLIEGIHTDKDLGNFMAHQQSIRDPYDTVQYKFFLIPDFNEKEGAVVIKIHHCMMDGLGAAGFFHCVSNEFDVKSLPALKPLPFIK